MPDVKFSNQYPYTDFHELNLDWVIKEVKYWSTKVGKTIQSIELTGTVGLVDTYTINYSDGSTSTFDVTNGNGIASVAKTGTVGLVDTYTITFQDGSMSTFDVTNGTAAIDKTLTLSNYAADSKTTGDMIKNTIGNSHEEFTPGSYVTVNDLVNSQPVLATNSAYSYVFLSCSANEIFNIKGTFGYNTQIRGWVFYKSNGERLYNGLYNVTYVDWYKIIIPTNAAFIAFNALTVSNPVIIKGQLPDVKYNGNRRPIDNITFEAGYITINGSNASASNYYRSSMFQMKSGQTLYSDAEIRSSSASLITRWTDNGTFIETIIGGIINTSVQWTAPFDCYIKVCCYTTADNKNTLFTISDPIPQENAERISDLEDRDKWLLYQWERILNNVCCIGDSLTAGAYYVNGHGGNAITQNYPYFFAKQTGLSVQNEGASGSSPSSRWSYFSTYDFTPYNTFLIWWGTNGGLTDTLQADGVIDGGGNLNPDYTQYSDTNTGDYCKVIGRIISQVPHAKIFLGTVYTSSGNKDLTNTVIAEIAELYPDNVMGIVNCDDGTLYNQASKMLTPSWVHIDNTTHFSMVGNYYLAVHWLRAIRTIIAIDPESFEDIMEDIIS